MHSQTKCEALIAERQQMSKSVQTILYCIIASLVPKSVLYADIVTYPGPAGIERSSQYAVQVMQEGRTRDSFVYMSRAQWRSNRSETTSWTTFSFSGKVTVRVTKRSGDFQDCKILPTSCRIKPKVKGNSIEFRLDKPRKVSVEFDGDITEAGFQAHARSLRLTRSGHDSRSETHNADTQHRPDEFHGPLLSRTLAPSCALTPIRLSPI